MARARNIKPGFYKNEDLAECSIWARFIFPGLWMLADREGRLEDRPKRIKGELLPFDIQDVDPLLSELEARGFILRYQKNGSSFIQILKFKEHQAPHYSEKESLIPSPFRELCVDDETVIQGKLQEYTCHHDTNDPEKSGKTPSIKRGSQPPDSLNPDSLNPDSQEARLPAWLDRQAWVDWVAFRKRKSGKGWTLKAEALSLRTLAKLHEAGNDPRSVIEQSIERGWTGLFPLKTEPLPDNAIPVWDRA